MDSRAGKDNLPEPKIGDSSDAVISYSTKRNLHGWSVEEWIEFLYRHPDASTPNGVARAVVNHYEEQLKHETAKS